MNTQQEKHADMSQVEHPTGVTPSDYLSEHMPLTNKRGFIIFVITGALALLMMYFLPKHGFTPDEAKGLAILFSIAVLWLTEAVHTTVTALMVPVVAVFCHFHTGADKVFGTVDALSSFANPLIFLFLGGFALAAAMQAQSLDRKIAIWTIRMARGHFGLAILMMFVVTAVLSMGMSNTATTAMMLPLALGILGQLDVKKDRNTYVFTLLGIAYASSVGGIGTLVGTPPNLIAAGALNLNFMEWMKIGVPFVIITMPVLMLVLYFVCRPNLNQRLTIVDDDVPWNTGRVITLVIFVVTSLMWIFSAQLQKLLHVSKFETVVALGALVAICITGAARWKQISENTDWGVLLLFGGGITLSKVLKVSGAAHVLGVSIGNLVHGAPALLLLFVIGLFVVFLTEFSSNTATAALLVPLFMQVAPELGIQSTSIVVLVGVGVSLAFMMPISTPPNAIVMGSGLIRQREMMKAGIWLNLVTLFVLVAFAYWFVPLVL